MIATVAASLLVFVPPASAVDRVFCRVTNSASGHLLQQHAVPGLYQSDGSNVGRTPVLLILAPPYPLDEVFLPGGQLCPLELAF